jgi:hypothetical protein
MLDKIKADRLDIVVASRYPAEGSLGNFGASRVRISGFATRLSRLVVKAELSDPMSGFFMVERGAFDEAVRNLSGQGFKILLDLFASAPSPSPSCRLRKFSGSSARHLIRWVSRGVMASRPGWAGLAISLCQSAVLTLSERASPSGRHGIISLRAYCEMGRPVLRRTCGLATGCSRIGCASPNSLSNNAKFAEKPEVVGLYLDPPAHAVGTPQVLSASLMACRKRVPNFKSGSR